MLITLQVLVYIYYLNSTLCTQALDLLYNIEGVIDISPLICDI